MIVRLLRFLLHVVLALAACLMLMWGAGRLCNDRWYLTQYLWWMPTPLVAACFLLASLAVALGALVVPRTRAIRVARWSLHACTATVLLVFAIESHAWRYLRPSPPVDAASSVRVLAWNPAVDYMSDFAQRVAATHPALIAITNRPAYTDWGALQDEVGGSRSMARFAHLSLVSRWRILRWGGTRLAIQGARKRTTLWPGGGEVSQDQGEAFFAELDATPDLGRTLVVWMLDFPSDPELARDANFSTAAATLMGFKGPSYTRSRLNLDVLDEPGSRSDGFPSPDLIVGDFNTPRGSRSIARVTGGMSHAYDLAGRGWAPTWHRRVPFIAIDQTFVAPWLDVIDYSTPDMGAGQHRAQVIDLRRLAK